MDLRFKPDSPTEGKTLAQIIATLLGARQKDAVPSEAPSWCQEAYTITLPKGQVYYVFIGDRRPSFKDSNYVRWSGGDEYPLIMMGLGILMDYAYPHWDIPVVAKLRTLLPPPNENQPSPHSGSRAESTVA